MLDATERTVRKFVFDYFLEHANAPSVPEIAAGARIDLDRTKRALRVLDEAHHLKLLDGTSRILMAFPFSALATPYVVVRTDGRRYFANCAWDSIAFHSMLAEPVHIESFCDRCARPVRFDLDRGRPRTDVGGLPSVVLELPASDWWKDITRTCANTMVFWGSEESDARASGASASSEPGRLTVDQVLAMSVPIYAGRMRLEYDRPPPEVLRATFARLGLNGAHWTL